MKTFRIIGLAFVAILICLSACSSGSDDPIEPTPQPEVIQSEISIDSKAVNGTVGTHVVNAAHTEATTHEINRPSVSKKLAKIGWSNAPLDTMLRNIGKGSTIMMK